MLEELNALLDDYDLSLEDLLRYIKTLFLANKYLIAEARAFIESERRFHKKFKRTDLFETPDLISDDESIWVEVKDVKGIAFGSTTLSRNQLLKLISGARKGKSVYIAVVLGPLVEFIELNTLLKEKQMDRGDALLNSILLELNKRIEKTIIKYLKEGIKNN